MKKYVYVGFSGRPTNVLSVSLQEFDDDCAALAGVLSWVSEYCASVPFAFVQVWDAVEEYLVASVTL